VPNALAGLFWAFPGIVFAKTVVQTHRELDGDDKILFGGKSFNHANSD
jgi:hypothetical protein